VVGGPEETETSVTYAGLERCDGPACPHCGCQDTELDRRRGRWGGSSVRHRCRHCGATWYPRRWKKENGQPDGQPDRTPEPTEQASEISPGGAVIYRPLHCPECGGTDTKITSTRRPVRHHKCRQCGASFKSVERE
jgi:hypothetical protein